MQCVDAQMIYNPMCRFSNILEREYGKIEPVYSTGFWIDGRGSSRAKTAPERINTDDEIGICANRQAGPDHVLPPASGLILGRGCGVRGRRQTTEYQHGVVAGCIEFAIRDARHDASRIDLPR